MKASDYWTHVRVSSKTGDVGRVPGYCDQVCGQVDGGRAENFRWVPAHADPGGKDGHVSVGRIMSGEREREREREREGERERGERERERERGRGEREEREREGEREREREREKRERRGERGERGERRERGERENT